MLQHILKSVVVLVFVLYKTDATDGQATQYQAVFTQLEGITSGSINNNEIVAKFRGSSSINCALRCLREQDCKVIDVDVNTNDCRLRKKVEKQENGRSSTLKKVDIVGESLKGLVREVFMSCQDVINQRRSRGNGVYNIRTGNTTTMTYCHIADIPTCGGGGWTLVMKIDGRTRNVSYNEEHWTEKKSLNIKGGQDLNDESTVLPTYWSTPLTKICLGMKQPDQPPSSTKWLKLKLKNNATSLLSVIVGDDKEPFEKLGVQKWEGQFAPELTSNGSYFEGVNVTKEDALVRLGVVEYDFVEGFTSFVGVGTFDRWQPSTNEEISCGYGVSDFSATTRKASLCYIFVQ